MILNNSRKLLKIAMCFYMFSGAFGMMTYKSNTISNYDGEQYMDALNQYGA